MDKQKDRLKQNGYPSVLEELEVFLESDTVESQNARISYAIKKSPAS